MAHHPFLRSTDEAERLVDVLIAKRVNEVNERNAEQRNKRLAIELNNAIVKAFGGR